MIVVIFSKNRGRNKGHVRHLCLVPNKQSWNVLIRSGPALSMTLLETVDGVHFFKFEHGPNYQLVEKKFLNCIQNPDPMQLMVRILNIPLWLRIE